MYSGSTLTPLSGRIIGAHQKLDRVARSHLSKITRADHFPKIRRILHFEGKKGPDAIKRKSPAQDEPWHYFEPFDQNDSELRAIIREHYNELVKQLRSKNEERAAFEASWLAHAIVDGLTPAHHHPYEQSLEEIWGHSKDERTTLIKKWFPPAETVRELVKKSWQIWGPGGLISLHGVFEFGIATILAPLGMKEAIPKKSEIDMIKEIGIEEWFIRSAREIAVLDMYSRFQKRGWSTKLIYDVRHKLGPTIVKTITLSWYLAAEEARSS